MKHFRRFLWLALVVSVVLLSIVAIGFKVDDMTLSKGEVYEFNENWTMIGEDGKNISIGELPYLGKSKPGETVIMENIIPKEYLGKTMSFLSADKTLRVWMDGRNVYEFGISDVRSFGHTPGSVVNFIDIPEDLSEGKIKIEAVSPYQDYAARATAITIGDRDVLILQLLRDNMFHILCNLSIIVCGVIFLLLFFVQKILKKNTDGMQYMCGYCVVTALYYSIETKVLHIFYGNQTFYSVMVFLCIMMIPFFIGMYYANSQLGIYKKRWQFLLGLVCANIVIQMILQLTGLVDFMDMAFASHALIMLTVVIVGKSYIDIIKEDKDVNIKLGMAALLFMGGGGAIDIVRMYVVAVGDMGKFSRFGTMIYGVIMLYQHGRNVVHAYASEMEESAKLLQREMEEMERKNEQLKQANELAEEARKDAIAADAAKGKFLAHMSHEIRTPINAVLGMDTMILRETRDAQIKEYALDIQNAGKNLLSLVNDILDFSKIESGKLEIIHAEYDFSSLIHDISNMIKTKVESKNLELNIYVKENLPSRLLGDDVRIRQVLVNLLNNAVKYTREGSITLRVDGTVENGKVVLDFSVEDTGIGIKEEDIAKLFNEFERIEEKRNRNIEGTGLGMNITAQLLSLMGTKINVESAYGKGTKFYFTLEQQIADSTPIGNLEERIRKQSTEYEYMATFVAPDARILVVDDNLVNLKVFVGLLKRTKVNVDVADSGKECLKLIEQKHYDLIFLDHMMPEMDGIETLHCMKEMPENKSADTPIVALTANAITGAKEMYLREGFDAFLPKPINPEKLEQMILRLLPRDLLLFDAEEVGEAEEEPEVLTIQYAEDAELPLVDGVDWSYGMMHLPDRELFVETVEDFYKAIDAEANKLEEYYREMEAKPETLQDYRIKVHSMKNSANLIGATVLGGLAKLLENAARDGDMDLIKTIHGIFIKEWMSYKDKLKECGGVIQREEENPLKQVEDYTIILAYLEMLRVAFEEMDIDEMDKAMDLLKQYWFPANIQTEMEQLSVQVINMDVEQATLQIEELMTLIKENKEWRME